MSDRNLPVIEIKKLSHTYLPKTPLEVRSLSEVDLEVIRGETLGIIGPSGSGKSTLLYHLNGLFRPQSGEVLIVGVPLSDPKADIGDINNSRSKCRGNHDCDNNGSALSDKINCSALKRGDHC